MIHIEFVPSTVIGILFTTIGMGLFLLRIQNPSLSRGAT